MFFSSKITSEMKIVSPSCTASGVSGDAAFMEADMKRCKTERRPRDHPLPGATRSGYPGH